MTSIADLTTIWGDLLEVTATAEEIATWGTLTQVDRTNPNTVTTSVGLFGTDLTAFQDACAGISDTTVCDTAHYGLYTGWGVGVNWAASADATTADTDGVVFSTSLWSVEVEWGDNTTGSVVQNIIEAGIVASVAANAPTDPTDVSSNDVSDPFEAWASTPSAAQNAGPQFAFSLF
jgi:hypothetical protein